jgi:molybdate transport system substrate-binding protein
LTQAPLRGDLTVFAAASLTDAFNEIGQEFQKANPGVTPKFNFAASTALRTQLEQGAKADLFASADQVQMDNAKKAGVVEGEDRLFVKNKLVAIHPGNNPANIQSHQDLARPGIKIVLTDANVPIGAYARSALQKMSADPQYGADFGQKVLANLRSEEANVRAVVTKVQLGEADAAIVYASDVTPQVSGQVKSILIPDQFNTIATYPIAVVKDAPNKAAAQAFIAFVRSRQGQEILRKHNFIVDAETGAALRVGSSRDGMLALDAPAQPDNPPRESDDS